MFVFTGNILSHSVSIRFVCLFTFAVMCICFVRIQINCREWKDRIQFNPDIWSTWNYHLFDCLEQWRIKTVTLWHTKLQKEKRNLIIESENVQINYAKYQLMTMPLCILCFVLFVGVCLIKAHSNIGFRAIYAVRWGQSTLTT